jgi:hypothetical protein
MGVDMKKGFKAVLLVCRKLLLDGLGCVVPALAGASSLVPGTPLLAFARLAGLFRPTLASVGAFGAF